MGLVRGKAVLLGAAFLFAASANGEEGEAGRLMTELMSGRAPVGGPFVLTDIDGRSRALADFRGKLVLLYFGYTSCPDVCPTDLARIGRALRDLGPEGELVQPVLVTLDPTRDTPAILREYVAAFHPRFVALTGSEAEVRKVARDYKVFHEKSRSGPGTDLIDHTAYVFLLNRNGKYIAFFPPGTPSERMVTMIRQQLGDSR